MRLKNIKIENFRGIRSLDLPLDTLTVLIGENNVGKSTILEALRIVLARGLGFKQGSQFTEYDFYLKDATATPHTADPISIILHFAEEYEDEWSENIMQQLSEITILNINGCNNIWLQVKGFYNTETKNFDSNWAFLNNEGEELELKSRTPYRLLLQFIPLFYLSAIRNAAQEFGQRGQFWSGFLKSINLPDVERKSIEDMLKNVNDSVIGANQELSKVIQSIGKAKNLVPLDDTEPVTLEAIPTRVFDMVGKIQVHLKSSYGAKLPLNRHGEGTQSLAVLMLFQAFTASVLAETYTPDSVPLLALEEPEAHLHPSAIRSVKTLLDDLKNQIIMTSHSGDLISSVPITSLRRLYKKNGKTLVGQVDASVFTPKILSEIDYSLRLTKGHCLFARCWLLVEGESDFHIFQHLFELSPFANSLTACSIIDFSQRKGKADTFIKLAEMLGIQWFLVADGDKEGEGYTRNAKKSILASDTTIRTANLIHKDIEHEFWYNGYNNFFWSKILPQTQEQILQDVGNDEEQRATRGIKAAIKQMEDSKPVLAYEITKEIKDRGKDRGIETIPQSIKYVIEHVAKMCTEVR